MSIFGWITRLATYIFLAFLTVNALYTVKLIEDRLSSLMYVDSALKEYVISFVHEANNRDIKVSVRTLTAIFGTTRTQDDPDTVGLCMSISGYPVVIIDKNYWKVADLSGKEELIYHELAHCLLNRDHCEVEDSKGQKVSIMTSQMLSNSVYKDNREWFLNELFRPHERCGTIDALTD